MSKGDTKVSDEALEKLVKIEKEEKKDPKRVWVERMFRSAKLHYKRCPYFDHRTRMCFIALGEKCNRDGRFDGCSVFIKFLEKKYDEYVKSNRPLPTDFLDII